MQNETREQKRPDFYSAFCIHHSAFIAHRLILLLVLSTLLTTGIVAAMFAYNIPLGEPGQMVYRFSTLWLLRLSRCWPVFIAMALFVLSGRMLLPRKSIAQKTAVKKLSPDPKLSRAVPSPSRVALSIGFLGIAILCAWTWYLPPKPSSQHVFNLMSPSQDGAFALEAEHVGPIGDYLRQFPLYLQRRPEDVLGTRVLSNPPGMTLLAAFVRWTTGNNPHPWPERLFLETDLTPDQVTMIPFRLRLSFVLTGVLALSSIFAYLLARQFFSPMGAGLIAILITINPATVAFSPGKDPAQLLTINAMLWAWFASARHQKFLLATLSGAIFIIGCTFGLIHVWVALAAVIASFFGISPAPGTPGEGRGKGSSKTGVNLELRNSPHHNPLPEYRERGQKLPSRLTCSLLGAAVVCLVVQFTIGWNILLTLLAVAKRFGQIQNTIHYTRSLWWIIGLPLFWLFLSPVVPCVALLRRRSRSRRLLFCTVGVMLLTYLIGVTYELPRLWIAFIPLLTLGAAANITLFQGRPHRRAFHLILILLAVHLATTMIHASLLDARESEYRLLQARLFQ